MRAMIAEQRGLRFLDIRLALQQSVENAGVKSGAGAVQKTFVGGIPDQRMLERIVGVRRSAVPVDELGRDQPVQPLLQLRFRQASDLREQSVRELAADHGADLRNVPARRHPIETRQQRGFERRRQRDRAQRRAACRGGQLRTFQDDLGQLLDEQRHAIRPLDNAFDEVGADAPVTGGLRHQRGRLPLIEPGERDQADIVAAGPAHMEVGPERHDQQHRLVADPVDGGLEQIETGRIRPMQVLDHEDDRLFSGKLLQLAVQQRKRSFFLAPRTELRQGAPRKLDGGELDGEQIGQQRERVVGGGVLRKRRAQLCGFRFSAVALAKLRCLLEMPYDRMKRHVLVLGGAKVAQPDVVLPLQPGFQRGSQARLADSGLAGDQHHLAKTAPDRIEMAHQLVDLRAAADHLARTGPAQRFEPVENAAFASHPPDTQRLGIAPDRQPATILAFEQSAHLRPGRVTNHDVAGVGEALHP